MFGKLASRVEDPVGILKTLPGFAGGGFVRISRSFASRFLPAFKFKHLTGCHSDQVSSKNKKTFHSELFYRECAMFRVETKRFEITARQPGRIGRLIFVLVLIAAGWIPAAQSLAQGGGRLPRIQLYNQAIFDRYYRADYSDAARFFNRGANGAYKRGLRRHLDSICYWTMMGECNYHMGNYAQAVTMYEQALTLYLSYQAENWQVRLQLPATIQANNNALNQARILWGVPQRRSTYANMPGSFNMMFGRIDAARAFQEGGAYDPAEIFSVDIVEIMRCTALCLHRRRTIKGPLARLDPFTSQLVTGLSVPGAGNGTVMGAMNGVLLGIAQASTEDWSTATKTLKASLELNRMEHPLTPVALLELAQIGFANQNYAVASQIALEASYSAAVFNQFDLAEEALGLGTTIHLMNNKTPYPPLENAIKWASAKDARMMQASLIVKLAECFAEAGDPVSAAKVLRESGRVISKRNSLGKAVVSARVKYVSALISFLKGDFKSGKLELAAALDHFQTGSLWLYRLALADQLAKAGNNQRQADLLYSTLLRDPTETDWRVDPMESIAFLASPHVGTMERWFDIVVDRKDHRRSLEIAELVRRHRFFASLPMGGRLMALRWVMHAPDEALTQKALGQRQEFLNRNPAYTRLINEEKQIRTALLLLPVRPESQSPEEREQLKLMKELAKVSETQEAMLASFALRREPAEMAFPPQSSVSEFQGRIEKDQLALVTLATASGYHIFLMSTDAIQYVGLSRGRDVLRGVADLLKEMGLMEVALDLKIIQDEQWKVAARELKEQLFAGASDDNWKNFTELVVVPDGVLWYLPFEVLPVGEGDEEKFLSEIVNVRYSPTLFLGFHAQRPARETKRSAVVTLRMHSRGEAELSNLEFDELKKALPDVAKFDASVRIPTNYLASVIDQLVVWSEIGDSKNLPLAMLPMQNDKERIGSTLDAWMTLPWSGPEHVVMPGFHSDGGAGLRGKLNGNDLFLTSLGLMASGTRTALISRWATGGQTALELTRQYAEQLPQAGVAQAIRNSRQKTRELDLDYENEPRLRTKKSDPVLKAEHPFFWAAHMLFSIPDSRPRVAQPGNGAAAGDAGVKEGDGEKPDAEKDANADDKAALPGEDKAALQGDDKAALTGDDKGGVEIENPTQPIVGDGK